MPLLVALDLEMDVISRADARDERGDDVDHAAVDVQQPQQRPAEERERGRVEADATGYERRA